MGKKSNIIIAVIGIIGMIGIILLVLFMRGNSSTINEPTLTLEEIDSSLSSQIPFNEMATQEVTITELESYFQINPENVEQVVGKIPLMNVHASMYLVVSAKDGKAEEVQSEIESFGISYEQQWETYLPEQYSLVMDRKIGIVGNYVYLIVSENADTLVNLIK